MADLVEVLIEEGAAQAVAGVGEKRVDGAAADGRVDAVVAVDGRQIDLQCLHRRPERLKSARRLVNRGIVGGDEQIEAFLRAQFRQLVADAARCAGDDRQRFVGVCH